MTPDPDRSLECPCCGERAHPDEFWPPAYRHADAGCPHCGRSMAELRERARDLVGEQADLESWGETA